MGRQSARIWDHANDHKDIIAQGSDLRWYHHDQLYYVDEDRVAHLWWEKLPDIPKDIEIRSLEVLLAAVGILQNLTPKETVQYDHPIIRDLGIAPGTYIFDRDFQSYTLNTNYGYSGNFVNTDKEFYSMRVGSTSSSSNTSKYFENKDFTDPATIYGTNYGNYANSYLYDKKIYSSYTTTSPKKCYIDTFTLNNRSGGGYNATRQGSSKYVMLSKEIKGSNLESGRIILVNSEGLLLGELETGSSFFSKVYYVDLDDVFGYPNDYGEILIKDCVLAQERTGKFNTSVAGNYSYGNYIYCRDGYKVYQNTLDGNLTATYDVPFQPSSCIFKERFIVGTYSQGAESGIAFYDMNTGNTTHVDLKSKYGTGYAFFGNGIDCCFEDGNYLRILMQKWDDNKTLYLLTLEYTGGDFEEVEE